MYNDNHTLTTNITGVQIVHPAFTIFISFPWIIFYNTKIQMVLLCCKIKRAVVKH